MDTFVIQGGNPLAGTVRVSGSKNAALPIMAAALACEGTTQLFQVPDLADVRTLGQLLTTLGADVERTADGDLKITVRSGSEHLADYELVRKMRASVCVLGPLLARRGRACVSLPGGCNIGHRPIDLHLKGLVALGAEIDVRGGYVHARASRLKGTTLSLCGPHGSTVTGTCNVMTAAALARGTTVIDGAAREPEIVALADFLNRMGARIHGHGTSQLIIDGVAELQPTRCEIIPDRIEAGTLLCAAAIAGGNVQLENVIPGHLSEVLQALREVGVRLDIAAQPEPHQPTSIQVEGTTALRPLDITALPYPGVPTDLQAQFTALLCRANGTSIVRDLVFPDRFIHLAELNRMGAAIRQQGSGAVIHGGASLTGAHVMASDLRASAALVLASLAAQGETVIHRIYHLDRGYERLEDKLCRLGARVVRTAEEDLQTVRRMAPAA